MLKYIVMAALFCLLPGCAEQPLPPPPPPMPFTVVWAPNEAPIVGSSTLAVEFTPPRVG